MSGRARSELAHLVAGLGGYLAFLEAAGVQGVPPRRRTLEQVRADLGDCTRCRLAQGRTHLVFGVGNPRALVMLVGEAPGREEDLRGEPFVGAAGQLLDRMLGAIGLSRGEVYIANVLKCRPPGNRDPLPDEIASCRPFLLQQIEAIRPRLILTLGGFAAQVLLGTSERITRLRGRFHALGGIRVLPTYHPAFLLRNPARKREAWEDLQGLQREYLRVAG